MQKQIEEMANDLAQHCPDLVANCCGAMPCVSCLTKFLYDAGYRKQEWISVEERLPAEDVRVLVWLRKDHLTTYTRIDTDRHLNGVWVRWYESVTHWMPLPEPPKGAADEKAD
jgi:hypothetical protein